MARNEEIYKLLIDISENIGHLKGVTEQVLSEQKKTNGRVTTLEQWKWKTTGYMAGALAIIEFIFRYIIK